MRLEQPIIVHVEGLHERGTVDDPCVSQEIEIRHNGNFVARVRVLVWTTDISIYLDGPEGGSNGHSGYSLMRREPEFYAGLRQKQKEQLEQLEEGQRS